MGVSLHFMNIQSGVQSCFYALNLNSPTVGWKSRRILFILVALANNISTSEGKRGTVKIVLDHPRTAGVGWGVCVCVCVCGAGGGGGGATIIMFHPHSPQHTHPKTLLSIIHVVWCFQERGDGRRKTLHTTSLL